MIHCAADAVPAESPRADGTLKSNMLTQTDDSAVAQKTRELCLALLDQPNTTSIRGRINAFMSDEKSRGAGRIGRHEGQGFERKANSRPCR